MSVHFDKVVIIGVGLIGASLAIAGRKKGLFGEVIGVGRGKANLERALEMGALSRFLHDPKEACQEADLVVLATPVEEILSIGRTVAPVLRRGGCLTDVGSVKLELVKGLDGAVPPGVHFVGGHPIAGSEESGAASARIDLFQGSRTVLTPTASTDRGALKKIRFVWETVGSDVVEMDAAEHDLILGSVSHLPHMVAFALVDLVADLQEERSDISLFAAGGFKDITRIASSHPEMWLEICKMNKNNLVRMIEQFEAALGRIKENIRAEEFDQLLGTFERARKFRNSL